MADTVTAEDPRYKEIFNVSREAEALGEAVGDLSAEMNALREKGRVQ